MSTVPVGWAPGNVWFASGFKQINAEKQLFDAKHKV